jgi:hypothetical protein
MQTLVDRESAGCADAAFGGEGDLHHYESRQTCSAQQATEEVLRRGYASSIKPNIYKRAVQPLRPAAGPTRTTSAFSVTRRSLRVIGH